MLKLRYLIEYYIVLFIRKIVISLDFYRASFLFGKIFRFIGPKTRINKKALRNISIAFPNLTDEEKYNITLDMWEHYGNTFSEVLHIPYISEKIYKDFINVIDIENLDYLKNGGFIFSAHYGNWDIVPRLFLSLKKKISILYRKSNNIYVDALIQETRQINENIKFIQKGKNGVRDLVKAIKEKHIIIMLVDQRLNEGIRVPFFGKDVMTAPAIAKLALQYNMPIIAVCPARDKNRKHLNVKIYPPLKIENTGNIGLDTYNIMLNINQIIEEWIIEDPSQWFFIHDRWKMP